MKFLILTAALALSGCVTLDKDNNVSCYHYDSLLVDGAVMSVNVNKDVVNGSLAVVCGANSVTFTSSVK